MVGVPKVSIVIPLELAVRQAREILERKQDPCRWECQDYHAKKSVTKKGDAITIKTEHTIVELDSDDLKRVLHVMTKKQ